jgi:DNA-binding transcriptional LysR family regulator
MIDFRELRYFIAVAEQMHFGRAANQLHIAQPSLSLKIRQLEQSLDIILFERTTRSVKLTSAGKVFYEEAVRAVGQMEFACRIAQRAAHGELGRLALGYCTSAIMGELPGLIQRYHEEFPAVELVLRELHVDTLVERIHAGELDLMCSDSGIDDAELNSIPILSSPGVLAMHRSHPLAHKHTVKLAEFAGDDFIFPADYSSHHLYDQMIEHCHRVGFVPKVRHMADSVPGAVSLVAAKLGVAMVYAVPGYRPPAVIFKRVSDVTLDLRMRLSWRAGRLTPIAAKFVKLIDGSLPGSAVERG